METLRSLWEALNVPAEDIDRDIFGRLMEGPHNLYKSSHDKVERHTTLAQELFEQSRGLCIASLAQTTNSCPVYRSWGLENWGSAAAAGLYYCRLAWNVEWMNHSSMIYSQLLDRYVSCCLTAIVQLQCKQEIARLEGARKDLMMGIIDSKRQQLRGVCTASHMPVPPLPENNNKETGEVNSAIFRASDSTITADIFARPPGLQQAGILCHAEQAS